MRGLQLLGFRNEAGRLRGVSLLDFGQLRCEGGHGPLLLDATAGCAKRDRQQHHAKRRRAEQDRCPDASAAPVGENKEAASEHIENVRPEHWIAIGEGRITYAPSAAKVALGVIARRPCRSGGFLIALEHEYVGRWNEPMALVQRSASIRGPEKH